MTFTQLCVGLVITVLVSAGIFALSSFIGWVSDDTDFGIWMAAMFGCIGFGVCLTMLLYQNHIL